jgi:hypothetical protein
VGATFSMQDIKQQRLIWLKKELDKTMTSKITQPQLIGFIIKLYEKSYSGIDLIRLLEDSNVAPLLTLEKRYELLFQFSQVRREFRNEKLIMLFILNFAYLSSNVSLENISFM